METICTERWVKRKFLLACEKPRMTNPLSSFRTLPLNRLSASALFSIGMVGLLIVSGGLVAVGVPFWSVLVGLFCVFPTLVQVRLERTGARAIVFKHWALTSAWGVSTGILLAFVIKISGARPGAWFGDALILSATGLCVWRLYGVLLARARGR